MRNQTENKIIILLQNDIPALKSLINKYPLLYERLILSKSRTEALWDKKITTADILTVKTAKTASKKIVVKNLKEMCVCLNAILPF